MEFQNVNKAFVYITDCNPSLKLCAKAAKEQSTAIPAKYFMYSGVIGKPTGKQTIN